MTPMTPMTPMMYAGKHALVLGLGESGLAMAQWLAGCGATVRVADTRTEPQRLQQLRNAVPGVEFVCGEFSDALLDGIDFTQAECWGATESWQHRYHLQSYLLAFSPAVVASDAWRTFWAGVRPTWSKNWLIRIYEIGLTQAMLKAGFRCRAVWPYAAMSQAIDPLLLRDDDETGLNLADPAVQVRRTHASRIRAAAVRRQPLNPTSDLWRQLLAAGYPFLKRELLRDNPTFVLDIGDWRDVVEAMGVPDAIIEPIERDLQRTLKDRSA